MRHRWILGGAALTVAILAFSYARCAKGGLAERERPSRITPGGEPASPREVVARTRLTEPEKLLVRVESPNIDQVHGRATWKASARALLNCDPLISPGNPQLEFDGHFAVPVPSSHWVWLRVETGVSPRKSFYRLVRPGGRVRHVTIDSGRRGGLHVFLREEDMLTPAKSGSLRLFARSLEKASVSESWRRLETDDVGYCHDLKISSGAFVICAPNASPGDQYPHATGMILGLRGNQGDAICLLAAKRRSEPVRFSIECGLASDLPRPALYLTGIAPNLGKIIPLQHGAPARGRLDFTMNIAPGQYRVDALPWGLYDVVVSDGVLEIPAGRSSKVRATLTERGGARAVVRLIGIGRGQLPIRVTPRDPSRLKSSQHENVYLGPHQWARLTMRTPTVSEPVYLVAQNRHGSWISRRPETLKGTVDVAMAPAARVFVKWSISEPIARPGIVVNSDLGEEIFLPKRTMHRDSTGFRALLECTCHLPNGEFTVSGIDLDSERVAWTRKSVGTSPIRSVVVGNQGN